MANPPSLSHNLGAGFPQINAPIVDPATGTVSRPWYQFFVSLWQSSQRGVNPIQGVSVGPSPFTYSIPVGGMLLITGGTGLMVNYSRDGNTYYPTGMTQGALPVAIGDQVQINYTSAPTLVLVPQ